MDNFFLSHTVVEIAPLILNRTVSHAWTGGRNFVLEFEGQDRQRLVVVTDPASPGLYLTNQRLASSKPVTSEFLSTVREVLIGTKTSNVLKHPGDRLVKLSFDSLSGAPAATLLLSLMGRATNVYLRNSEGEVISRLFNLKAPDVEGGWSDETTDILSPISSTGLEAAGDEIARLGPRLTQELQYRCSPSIHGETTRRSVLLEILGEPPAPLVYSSIPLEEIGNRIVDPSRALVLSCIEMTHLRGCHRNQFDTLSEAAERYYRARSAAASLQAELASLKREITAAVKKRRSTLKGVESDLERFADPERLKQFGDLILASLNSAKVTGETIRLVDYFDAAQTEIEVAIPPDKTLQQAAAHYYSLAGKAKRAKKLLEPRARELSNELAELNRLLGSIADDPTASSVEEARAGAESILGKTKRGYVADSPQGKNRQAKKRSEARGPGRRFTSSDGYEIVVGRTDTENDSITFKLAGSQDVWLHAADYPGSHVVIRNPKRLAVPHQTIVEAAQLAAFYSSAKNEKKAAVHYTQKKYVTKPPRSKPGLVRLSSFKTLMVGPSRRV